MLVGETDRRLGHRVAPLGVAERVRLLDHDPTVAGAERALGALRLGDAEHFERHTRRHDSPRSTTACSVVRASLTISTNDSNASRVMSTDSPAPFHSMTSRPATSVIVDGSSLIASAPCGTGPRTDTS